ncbi:MAG: undecaprenyldiphospho-muramoylpentapeptide beta-N-acetylglucosaminyltransferase [Rickettsiales bacterium]|nr:undecaprenyldiphospho-muramoylpentapeptide beta-N-acetylglucosaminyltransferase [Rickettsiales bacterium]
MNKQKKIFLATGGSGGHIFPAISVADILIDNKYDVKIISDDVYEKYAKGFEYEYEIIKTGKNLKKIKDIKNIIFAIFKAKKILLQQKPDLVVGFGCYATLPVLFACVWTKTPFILHEQNVYIGKTNKFFLKYALKIMTAYPEIYGISFKYFEKIVFTGQPIRKQIKELNAKKYDVDSDENMNIVITGGSLGAKIFSEKLPYIFDMVHKEEQKKIKVYHQIQADYIGGVQEYYKKIDLNHKVETFFNNMDKILEKAHLVIGRAGNGTLTETAVAGLPAILIPLPTAANNHQVKNAMLFEKLGAVVVVQEKNFDTLQEIFFNLIKNKKKLKEMAEKNKKSITLNGDVNILEIINNVFEK